MLFSGILNLAMFITSSQIAKSKPIMTLFLTSICFGAWFLLRYLWQGFIWFWWLLSLDIILDFVLPWKQRRHAWVVWMFCFARELGANEGLAAVREDTKDQLDFKYFIEKYKEKQWKFWMSISYNQYKGRVVTVLWNPTPRKRDSYCCSCCCSSVTEKSPLWC